MVGLENGEWRFWAFKGTSFGSKKWFGSDANRKRKKGLVKRRLGNSYFPKNEATGRPCHIGGPPGRGVGGSDKSLPGGMASKKLTKLSLKK